MKVRDEMAEVDIRGGWYENNRRVWFGVSDIDGRDQMVGMSWELRSECGQLYCLVCFCVYRARVPS